MTVRKKSTETTENRTTRLSVQEVLGLAKEVNMWTYVGEHETHSGMSNQAGRYTGSIKICRGEVRIELAKSRSAEGSGYEYTIAAFNGASMLSSKKYGPADMQDVKNYYDTLHERHPMVATLRRHNATPSLDEMAEAEKLDVIREFLVTKRLI